jgi:hypothetical protein
MINLVQNLETSWYLSPPWGKEIPPLEVSLLEKVYVTTTKSFGYCCGVEWSAKAFGLAFTNLSIVSNYLQII